LSFVLLFSGELVQKLADGIQEMRQPITALETLLSWLDVNQLQFDETAASNGQFAHLYSQTSKNRPAAPPSAAAPPAVT